MVMRRPVELVKDLGSVRRGPTVLFKFELRRLNDVLYFDARKHVSQAGGAPTPTTQGVSVRAETEELTALRDAVNAAIEEIRR
jgi:hypothetical protein